jgi:hypothetical protein
MDFRGIALEAIGLRLFPGEGLDRETGECLFERGVYRANVCRLHRLAWHSDVLHHDDLCTCVTPYYTVKEAPAVVLLQKPPVICYNGHQALDIS